MSTTFAVNAVAPVNNDSRLRLEGENVHTGEFVVTYVPFGLYHRTIRTGDVVTVEPSLSMFFDKVVRIDREA